MVDRALVDRVRGRLVHEATDPTPAAVARALLAEGRVLGDAGVRAVVDALHAELVGLGPLQVLLDSPSVTDILVVGANQVWIDDGSGLRRVKTGFRDDGEVVALAQRLAASCGRRLDDAQPFVDARLNDGVRLHAVLPPVAERPCLSLRMQRRRAFSLEEMVALGTVAEPMADLVARIVDQRLAFLVTGGTGSGKTTMLATMLGLVPLEHRVVVVEDTAELAPAHPHVVRLQSRPPNVEGQGEVTVRTLVRQALRMRPDRLVVGEVRGAEVVDLLAALNTGHEGGCGTLHANSVLDVPARVEALAVAGDLNRQAVHSQLASALDVVLHLDRGRDGERRLTTLGVLTRDRDRDSAGQRAEVTVVEALSCRAAVCTPGPGWDLLDQRLHRRAW
ncbi:MAG: TadA family conjugal transfer-associated ATPase [Actinomycetes bacterium]